MLFIDQMLHACDDVRLVCVYSAFSPGVCRVCAQEKGKGQLQQLQEDADQVVVIMQKNFNKVGEREEKLEELDKRADALLKSVNMNLLNALVCLGFIETIFKQLLSSSTKHHLLSFRCSRSYCMWVAKMSAMLLRCRRLHHHHHHTALAVVKLYLAYNWKHVIWNLQWFCSYFSQGKQFRKSTRKLKQKTETENARLRCKNWRVIAGVVALIIIITIIIIIIIAVLWPR